jgi:hypothetical protein
VFRSSRNPGFKSLPTERIEWDHHKIPATTFIPMGDRLFGSFKLIDSHLKSTPSDPLPSYFDIGFGSDTGRFAGCSRFSLHRDIGSKEDSELSKLKNAETASEIGLTADEEVEVRYENFRCNPSEDVVPWVECIGWFHYWYARLLFADGISSVLRR